MYYAQNYPEQMVCLPELDILFLKIQYVPFTMVYFTLYLVIVLKYGGQLSDNQLNRIQTLQNKAILYNSFC